MGMFDDIPVVTQAGNKQAEQPKSGGMFDDIPESTKQSPNVGGEQSTFMDMVDSFNAKVTTLGAGALQGMAKGLQAVGVDTQNFQNKLGNVNATYQKYGEEARRNSPRATVVSDIVGDLANVTYTSAATGGLGLGSTSGTAVGRALQQGSLAGLESASEYGSGEDRLKKGSAGFLLGSLGSGAIDSLGYLGKTAASGLFKRPVQAAADEINSGRSITAGQATENPTIQGTEEVLGKVPLVGAKGNVANAAQDIQNQANDVFDEFGVKSSSLGDKAGMFKKYINDAELKAKSKVSADYNKAADFLEKNNIDIPLSNAQATAQKILESNNTLTNKGFTAAKLGPSGELLDNFAKSKSISANQFEDLRKLVGDKIGDFKKGSDPFGMYSKLTQIKKAMDDDLVAVEDNVGGEGAQLLKNARQSYIDNVKPFKDSKVLDKAGNPVTNPDELLNQALKKDSPFQIGKIMEQLPPEGQKLTAAALIQKTINNATDKTTKILDLQKFNQKMNALGETVDALPEHLKAPIKGLQEVITNGDHILKTMKPDGKILSIVKGAVITAATAGAGLGYLSIPGVAIAAVGSKLASYALTNPRMVKQLVRLAGGNLNKQTKTSTIKHILDSFIKTEFKAAPAAVGSASAEYLNDTGYLDSVNK